MWQGRGRIAGSVLAVGAAVLLSAGCGVASRMSTSVRNARANTATIDEFARDLDRDQTVPFEATYTATGSSPATIVYAVDPSTNNVAFRTTTSGSNGTTVWAFVSTTGTYLCNQSSAGAVWSCSKRVSGAADVRKLADIYTPSHWIDFLQRFTAVAGLTGDTVTSSTMSLNGFDMNCVDIVAKDLPGTSTICSTSQGILGYVMVAQLPTRFAITDYSSPDPALFRLPPGATVTPATP